MPKRLTAFLRNVKMALAVAGVPLPSVEHLDPLAQLAEHLTFNQGVPRSSRGWVTIFRTEEANADVAEWQTRQT